MIISEKIIFYPKFEFSLSVICIKFSKNLFVESRATCLSNFDIELRAYALNTRSSSIKGLLVLTDTLDAHRSLLVDTVANIPLNDAEVDIVFFTCV